MPETRVDPRIFFPAWIFVPRTPSRDCNSYNDSNGIFYPEYHSGLVPWVKFVMHVTERNGRGNGNPLRYGMGAMSKCIGKQ